MFSLNSKHRNKICSTFNCSGQWLPFKKYFALVWLCCFYCNTQWEQQVDPIADTLSNPKLEPQFDRYSPLLEQVDSGFSKVLLIEYIPLMQWHLPAITEGGEFPTLWRIFVWDTVLTVQLICYSFASWADHLDSSRQSGLSLA